MKFGLSTFPTATSIHPAALARAAEERGFESLFFPEHTHIPASRRTPYPLGGDVPPLYWQMHDPFVALAHAAAVTERLRLATGVCLVPQHNPIALAKRVASLDVLSGGRFLFGIGAGWNAEEMENHGVAFERRWALLRESVLAMKQIWTRPDAEFHGELVSFDPVWCEPKPRQQPNPPIYIGASSRASLRRVVEYADGWMPAVGTCDLERRLEELGRLCEDASRDRASIEVTAFGAVGRREVLDALEKLGVDRVVLGLVPGPESAVLDHLDRLAALVD